MRVLVTGAAGFVGRRLVGRAPDHVEVVGTWRRQRPPGAVPAHRVDLADRAATMALVERLAPDVVVHTAYATADLGRDVVATTTHVADATAASGAALVHLSSDVVFSGEDAPYAEAAPPSPVSAYGRAKAAAEAEVAVAVPDAAVVRTSLVLDPDSDDPRMRWVADALAAGRPVDLFVDEVRMPVHRDDLVDGIWRLLARPRRDRAGAWHLVGPEALSRWDLGTLVARRVGADRGALRAVPSPRDVDDPRPRDLRLAHDRAREAIGWAPRAVAELYRTVPGP